jgi:hypothetical protein
MHSFFRPALLLPFLIVIFSCLSTSGFAQESPDTSVLLTFKDIKRTGPKSFEYAVYASNTGKVKIALKAYSWGLNLADGCENCGTITHTFVSRDKKLDAIPLPKTAYINSQLRGTTNSAIKGTEPLIEPGQSICLATMKVEISGSWPSCYNPFISANKQAAVNWQAIQLTQTPGKTQCILNCYLGNNLSTIYMLTGREGKKFQGMLPVIEATMSPSPEAANAFKLNCK